MKEELNQRDIEQFSIRAHEDRYGSVGLSESGNCGVWVTPYLGGSKEIKGTWSLFVFPDGSGQLYLNRSATGACLGKPIKLDAPKFSKHRCEVRIGKNGSVDVIGAMISKFANEEDVPCGLPASRLCLPKEIGEDEDENASPIWICAGHDDYTWCSDNEKEGQKMFKNRVGI